MMSSIFRKTLENVAMSLAHKAGDENTPFPERIDALKALTVCYATLQKDKGKSSDASDGSTMADFQALIGESDGGSELHSGPGTRRADA